MNNIMNFKTKSETLKAKLFNLNFLGINTSKYDKELISLNKKYANISEVTANSFGSVATESKEATDLMYKNIMSELNELESKVQSIYMYYDMCNRSKNIDENLSDESSKKDLDSYIKTMMPFLNYFNSLNHENYNGFETALNTIYSTLYKLIKVEIRQTGTSTLLDSLLKNGMNESHLSNFINEDITNITDINLANKIKDIIKSNPLGTNVNKEIITIIAINEGRFKQNVYDEMQEILDEMNDKIAEADLLQKNKNNSIISTKSKSEINAKLLERLFYATMSNILIVLNIGGAIFINYLTANSKKQKDTETTYNTTIEYYDTVNGSSTENKYTNDLILGDATIKVCYPTRSDNTRYEEIYLFNKNEYTTAEEYVNADYSQGTLISSENVVDEESNNISKDKLTTVTVVSDINKDDYISSKLEFKTYLVISLEHIITALMIAAVNYKLADEFDWSLDEALENKIFRYNLICIIRNYINDLNEIKKYYPKEYKKLKKEIEQLSNKYELLMKKYSYVTEYFDHEDVKKLVKEG